MLPRGEVELQAGEQRFRALIDSDADVTVVRADLFPEHERDSRIPLWLESAFGHKVPAELGRLPLRLVDTESDHVGVNRTVPVECAFTEKLAGEVDCLLSLEAWNALQHAGKPEKEDGQNETGLSSDVIPEDEGLVSLSDMRTEDGDTSQPVAFIQALRSEVDVSDQLSERTKFKAVQREDASLAEAWDRAGEGSHEMSVDDGVLYHSDIVAGQKVRQLVLPECKREQVLKMAHDTPW